MKRFRRGKGLGVRSRIVLIEKFVVLDITLELIHQMGGIDLVLAITPRNPFQETGFPSQVRKRIGKPHDVVYLPVMAQA